jgi:hypothetical protein
MATAYCSYDFGVYSDFDIELARVVDRLRTMPMTKLPVSADLAYGTASHLLDLTPGSHPTLPRIADRAAGDQLAVIGRDFRAAANEEAAVTEATAALVELRRALP